MPSAPPDPSAACPCGRLSARRVPQAFGDCCGRYIDHFDTAAAPDAEHLMRSRYSAFVLQRRNYLQATWHASTRPATLDLEPDARWLGLEVRSHRALDAVHAEVEFVARYRVAGRAVRLHERSRFVREDGRWYYLEGDQF
ncbi:MAG: YchJ family metal-binding protein [Burkholderiaceae bacterium]|nr:YchJ family metal-binding protein [Burkholderiaceae bacterium]